MGRVAGTTGRTHRVARAVFASLATLCIVACLAPALTHGAERMAPLPGVECTLVEHKLEGGLALRVRFSNATDSRVRLPAQPMLALYPDPGARQETGILVRVNTLGPRDVDVAGRGTVDVLYLVEEAVIDAMRCSVEAPLAAALVFDVDAAGRESLRRCVLAGFRAGVIPTPGCRPAR